MNSSPGLHTLLALLYLAGSVVLADQAADLTATLLANNATPSIANWRFGAFGLLVSRTSVLVVADVMLFAAAIGLGHRRVLRVLGALHLAIAVLLLGGLVLFTLDWLQVRSRVRAEAMGSFDLAALRAAVIVVLALGAAGWAGLTSLRATERSRSRSSRREDAAPLLTGIHEDEE